MIEKFIVQGARNHVRRRPFTLLEMMVVLALIALVAAAGTLGVRRLLAEQRFRAGTAQVEELLQIAQDTMTLYRAYIDVEMRTGSDGLVLTMESGSKLSSPLERYFGVEHRIPSVRSLRFDSGEEGMQSNEVQLKFYAPGSKMSRGLLLMGRDASLGRERGSWASIELPGYPTKLRVGVKTRLDSEEKASSEDLFPPELMKNAV